MHRLDCSQTEIDLTISEDPWPLTKPSTTLFPKSVKNQMDLNETSHQVSQMAKMTLTDLQTKNAESSSPRCPGTAITSGYNFYHKNKATAYGSLCISPQSL